MLYLGIAALGSIASFFFTVPLAGVDWKASQVHGVRAAFSPDQLNSHHQLTFLSLFPVAAEEKVLTSKSLVASFLQLKFPSIELHEEIFQCQKNVYIMTPGDPESTFY